MYYVKIGSLKYRLIYGDRISQKSDELDQPDVLALERFGMIDHRLDLDDDIDHAPSPSVNLKNPHGHTTIGKRQYLPGNR